MIQLGQTMHRVFRTLSCGWVLAQCMVIGLAAEGRAADWPQFRGPGGQATSTDRDLPVQWSPDENLLWQVELPGPGTSSPIVIGDRIYLTCYTGYREGGGSIDRLTRQLICLNRQDGSTRWVKEVKAKLPEQEEIREGHGYASSTPVADAKGVCVFFGKSGVFAFDHQGKPQWQADVGSEVQGWGSAASPMLYKNLVIVNASVESGSLVALNRATGKRVWTAGDIKEAWNTPILVQLKNGKTELAVAVFQKILGLDPDSGELHWSCDTNINWYMAPSLVSHNGIIYSVGGRTGGSLAVRAGGRGDVTETHRLWTGQKGSNVTSPVYHDGHLYWMHENLGIAYCADAKTGKILYEERVENGGQVYSSPVLADGKLFHLTRNGPALVIAAKPKFELLASNEIENRGIFNASPAISDNRLYIRSERFLYCIGKK